MLLTVVAAKSPDAALLTCPAWLFLLLLLPIATACLAWFFQMTFQKGMIFRKYKALITYWFDFKPRARYPFLLPPGSVLYPNGYLDRSRKIPAKWYAWFYKPLGGCIYCHSVWTGTAFYALTSLALGMGLEALWLWPLFVGVQYGWVKGLSKLFDE